MLAITIFLELCAEMIENAADVFRVVFSSIPQVSNRRSSCIAERADGPQCKFVVSRKCGHGCIHFCWSEVSITREHGKYGVKIGVRAR